MGVLSSVTIMLLSRQHPVVCLSAVAIRLSARACKYVCMCVCTAACFMSRLGLHGAPKPWVQTHCCLSACHQHAFPQKLQSSGACQCSCDRMLVAATAHRRGSLSNGCRVGVVPVVACVPARAWEESVSRSWTAIPPAFGPNRAVLHCLITLAQIAGTVVCCKSCTGRSWQFFRGPRRGVAWAVLIFTGPLSPF
jgi:hypothetical protein